jgi:hypothetical protein
MRTRLARAVVIALASVAGVAWAEAPAALAPLRFLLGEWRAVPSGKPGEATGSATFASSLRDHVILRFSYAEYPALASRDAFRHDDLMVIHADASAQLRADYWDNEGHIVHYLVQPRGSDEVVFLSEAPASEPHYRLTYKLAPDGTLGGRFEISPAGAAETFITYLTWSSRKVSRDHAETQHTRE